MYLLLHGRYEHTDIQYIPSQKSEMKIKKKGVYFTLGLIHLLKGCLQFNPVYAELKMEIIKNHKPCSFLSASH